ncbi:MAG: EVE domain-containing protein [Bradymonadales bacterium]|nr:MAG: EVE domain-containing protein [Bradymonadales bacterium]
MKYWLMKNEVEDYSIDDLKRDKKTLWTGVRNYQARNFMRDEMQPGDLAIFYHSNAEPSGAAGIMKIRGKSLADPTQFEKTSDYYDEKASHEKPRWFLREVEFVRKLKRLVSIQEMREIPACRDMLTLQKGSRLSITPLKKGEWDAILKASEKNPRG